MSPSSFWENIWCASIRKALRLDGSSKPRLTSARTIWLVTLSKGRTKRTDVMFGAAGHAYVYFIYGFYNMLNLVTEAKDYPAAVLIRAVEPVHGIE